MKARELVEGDEIITGENAARLADKLVQTSYKVNGAWTFIRQPETAGEIDVIADLMRNFICDEYEIEHQSAVGKEILKKLWIDIRAERTPIPRRK